MFFQAKNLAVLLVGALLVASVPVATGGELEDAFFRAIGQGDQNGVQVALSKNVDLETTNKDGWTPLMLASKFDNTVILKSLITAKADLEASDRNGFSPLMIAIQNYRAANARILLEAGADPDTWARIGKYFPFSAESEAKKMGMADIVELIQSIRQKRIRTALKENPILTQLKSAAEAGNVDAQVRLGMAYQNEELMPADAKESFKWYLKAAEQGHTEAQRMVGDSYMFGWGTPFNNVTALEWYKKAAEKGVSQAQYEVGAWFNSYTTNHLEAIKWLELAANQQHPEAHFILGNYYAKGKGMATNWTEARRHFLIAATKGRNVKAYLMLGDIYLKGLGDISANIPEAVNWYTQAALKLRSEEAMLKLGKIYSSENSVTDYRKATRWFAAAAKEDVDEGFFELAKLYEKGLGTTKDPAKAAELYERAAKKGMLEAQVCLAECYFDGMGVTRDVPKGLKWIRLAAESSGPEMQLKLGKMFLSGDRVPKDQKEAANWIFKAAAAGNVEAVRLSEQFLEN